MQKKLEQQADEFLLKQGYCKNGNSINPPSTQVEVSENANKAFTIAGIFASYDLFQENLQDTEITECISGSFATREVRFQELSFSIDIDFKKNTKFDDTTYFEWRLYNLIVQWYLADGYGIYHYQFIPKKGVYFALYKLLEDEIEEYKENYFRVCEGRGMTRIRLSETRRLYGIGEESKYDMVPGKRYVIHAKKITGTKRKTLETMFAKYQKELKKYTD